MCGICGIFSKHASSHDLQAAARTMADAQHHRGPDDSGTWADGEVGLALSHRRLSILDLSPEGHQPMTSAGGRFVIVFNGEIYNFKDLKEILLKAGHSFRGGSDTEIMLAAFEEWGVEESLRHFVGMFAFAVWDRARRVLTLARDRIGEKPLYFGWNQGRFMFASELKSFRALPQFKGEVDRGSLALFMKYNCVPAPWSIFKNIYKLPAAHCFSLGLSELENGWKGYDGNDLRPSTGPKPYWSAAEMVSSAVMEPFSGSGNEALSGLEAVLKRAISEQMIADVPLGAFLSGGVDSSTIVALMQAQSSIPVRTFSIGFHEKSFNEAHYAVEVAKHLGTAHTELYVTPKETLDVIPLLPEIYDEPFSDSSQIPTFLVSKLARSAVTVSLSGDGGDELFAGYSRYAAGRKYWSALSSLPASGKRVLSSLIRGIPQQSWDAVYGVLKPVLPNNLAFSNFGLKLHRATEMLHCPDETVLYDRMMSHWWPPAQVVPGAAEHKSIETAPEMHPECDFVRRMMYVDLMRYLPDDIMVKVDRAAMAVSLETRAPFLDHRVVEYVWSLPLEMKMRNGDSKWILRQLLYKYVPQNLIERPKMGFGVPVEMWIKDSLRDWAEGLLEEKRLKEQGFFDVAAVRTKWKEHQEGKAQWGYLLWDVLMFQAWLEAS